MVKIQTVVRQKSILFQFLPNFHGLCTVDTGDVVFLFRLVYCNSVSPGQDPAPGPTRQDPEDLLSWSTHPGLSTDCWASAKRSGNLNGIPKANGWGVAGPTVPIVWGYPTRPGWPPRGPALKPPPFVANLRPEENARSHCNPETRWAED